jgi:hypothetical protein
MVNEFLFTLMMIFVLIMSIISGKNRKEWYLFGILFCLMTIVGILFDYFGIWMDLLPMFLDQPLDFPGGIS